MKAIILFYSYSGNTKNVAGTLREYLSHRYEVESLELQAKDEASSFLGQVARAIVHTKADIAAVNFNLQAYDLICIGTPVWAFGPAPAINTYLNECEGAKEKKIVLFTTYGSGTGNRRCLNYMQGILTEKGAKDFKCFSIQQSKVDDKEFVLSKIKEAIV